MAPEVACPHCGEKNVIGSNICGRCMRDIRSIANPDRADLEHTAKTRNPHKKVGLIRRLKRWWIRRGRHAE